jgi:hypothetical protein
MTKPPLAKIVPVPLREYWTQEDAEFTPWLGLPENLKQLSDAIGIELEPHGQEVDVGAFRADLLCRDTATGNLVLIENQLEATDHPHLGQIVTYAAGLGAKRIVWIARDFREEHRAALDWLNEFTTEQIEFFGIRVELWRIADSPPAVRFEVVVHPNEWARDVKQSARAATSTSDSDLLRTAFWKSFGEHLDRTNSARGRPTVQPHPFWNWGIGRTNFSLDASIHPRKNRVAVFINLGGAHAKTHYHALHRDREAIERELGVNPLWQEKPDRKESMIRVEHDCDFEQPETWESAHRWITAELDRFDRVFRPRVRRLPSDGGL